MADYIRMRSPTKASEFTVIHCCPDAEAFRASRRMREQARAEIGCAEKFVVVYSGAMQPYQRPDDVLRVYRLIRILRPNAHFLALTPNAGLMRTVVANSGVDPSCTTILSLPAPEVPKYLAASDIGLLLRDRSTVNRVAAPVKFGEYIASGIPVIISDGLGDYSEAVRAYGLGIVVDSCDPEEVVSSALSKGLDTLDRRRSAFAEAADQFINQRLNLDVGLRELRQVYRSLAQANGERVNFGFDDIVRRELNCSDDPRTTKPHE